MKVARAIVEASLHYDDPAVLARVSTGLGELMHGLEIAALPAEAMFQVAGVRPDHRGHEPTGHRPGVTPPDRSFRLRRWP